MAGKKIYVNGIGAVEMQSGARNKSLRISLRPFESIKVSIPAGLSLKSAEKFVLQKKDWINKSLEKIRNIENQYTHFTGESNFTTKYHSLVIKKHDKKTLRIEIKKNFIYFYYPEFVDITDNRVQQGIRHAVEEAWRMEAKQYLPGRVKELAQQYGFTYQKISVKNAKSRWGSCSHQNNINLNLQLMRLPESLSDYIILHELTHTVHKNHGKEFWNKLNTITGNKARLLDREMKKYHLNVW
ncbi:MAG: M48 family metallopeptidase [Bacteroidales bacterium]|nr:M48 family metallopeptidase [Bacteroidales bacterium]